ncbi:MAG TPA: NADPH:quinone oxidoreductase family protein [Candidatus Dormibacteraeota bacterium]
MRAQQVSELGGPDALHLVDAAEPDPGGAVLIQVASAGVSFPDLLMSRGRYQTQPPLPFIPGVEVAGTVISAGDSEFAAGERVMAMTLVGGFAERVAAAPALTLRMPERLSFEQAGGFLMNYQTAYFALARRGRLGQGETLVVHGAAGGLGSAAVQVGRGLGARVIAVVSTDAKAEVTRAAGADEVVPSSGDWGAAVRGLTGGRGADVIIDPVGGDRFDQSIRALAPEGRLVVVGFTEGRIPSLQVNRILFRNIDIVGAAWGAFLAAEPQLFAAIHAALNEMIGRGAVAPIVGATFPLERAPDALRMLENRVATGKVVVTL